MHHVQGISLFRLIPNSNGWQASIKISVLLSTFFFSLFAFHLLFITLIDSITIKSVMQILAQLILIFGFHLSKVISIRKFSLMSKFCSPFTFHFWLFKWLILIGWDGDEKFSLFSICLLKMLIKQVIVWITFNWLWMTTLKCCEKINWEWNC